MSAIKTKYACLKDSSMYSRGRTVPVIEKSESKSVFILITQMCYQELHQDTQQKHAAFLKSSGHGQIPLLNSIRRIMGLEETENVSSVVESIETLSKWVEEVDQKGFTTEPREQVLVM